MNPPAHADYGSAATLRGASRSRAGFPFAGMGRKPSAEAVLTGSEVGRW